MFSRFLRKSIQVISRYATDPEDNEEWRLKKMIAIVIFIATPPLWLGYGWIYISYNEPRAGVVGISMGVLFIAYLLSYGIFRHFAVHSYLSQFTMIAGLVVVHILLGGFAQSGMVLMWLLISPLTLLVAYKPRQGLVIFGVAIVVFIVVASLQPYYLRAANNLPLNVITALFTANFLLLASIAMLSVYYFVWQNEVLKKLVLDEQAKTESVLLNILPKDIVAILKNENRIIADHFDNASILFADVVNFTPMSASLTPVELVVLLNEIYSYFDTLVEKYELEKIKTIGDCYMVAAGVPRPRSDHALVLTQLALDIRDFVSHHKIQGHQLEFRIGINSGAVVAGVIGRKKFAYDLWGDTVNTASRMESHGSGGFIQITEDTYALIKNDFNCESRGKVNVKGKGEIKVWYVVDKF